MCMHDANSYILRLSGAIWDPKRDVDIVLKHNTTFVLFYSLEPPNL